MYPKLYVGQIPDAPQARRALRERALDLQARCRRALAGEPAYILLHFRASDTQESEPIDLLLLRPRVAIVGVIVTCADAVDVRPDGRWIRRVTGEQLRGPHGETPLEQIRRGRDLVRRRLEERIWSSPDISPSTYRFNQMVGALICAPVTHPDTRVSLDIEDHRQQIKLLGLDELPALAAMLQTEVNLSEGMMRAIVNETFAGRCLHDGERLMFEPALSAFRLRVLAGPAQQEQIMPLLEGENVIGRRPAPLSQEYRLMLAGDDLISNDHATIICAPDGTVFLRDTSTNGTWVARPGGSEERVHRAERALAPGGVVRMGGIRMRLERSQG